MWRTRQYWMPESDQPFFVYASALMISISMPNLFLVLAADIVAFSATNIDDLFVLLGFMADPAAQPNQVIVGQYLGIGMIVGCSLALSLVSLILPLAWVGLMGILPIAIGLNLAIRVISHSQRVQEPGVSSNKRRIGSTALSVAAVTAFNGADNIAVYTPLFAVQTIVERGITVAVFLFMTGLWCWVAAEVVRHPVLGPPIRRWGRPLLPVVLIGLGTLVLVESGAFHLILGWHN
jgi:cadmium resistance protein CadD (predicted permease)